MKNGCQKNRGWLSWHITFLVLCGLVLTTVEPSRAEKFSGHFPDSALLDNFQRGITSRQDVIAALGEPVGAGSSLLPPDYRRRDILYYEQIDIGDMKVARNPDRSHVTVEIHQQVLGVLLLDDKFDGFMWFSTEMLGEALTQ